MIKVSRTLRAKVKFIYNKVGVESLGLITKPTYKTSGDMSLILG
ncbi:hypothetical protein Hanom_Chr02g00148721 [Helianthus anomalus]